MKAINEKSEVIFKKLIKDIIHEGYRQFIAEGYIPLTLECIGKLNTSLGSGLIYSLMHSFTQNGDLMRDPEMCFWWLETAIEPAWVGKVFPYMYQLDPLGIYQESITFNANGFLDVDLHLQQQHASFADSWLHNIQAQGFLK